MTPDLDLFDACQEWRRLAEIEGQAIRTRNWALVADCQEALRKLQPLISRQTAQARQAWAKLGPEARARETQLQEALGLLVRIESQNNNLLQEMRQAAQTHVSQIKRAGHMIRQVRRLYAPGRPAAWSSLS